MCQAYLLDLLRKTEYHIPFGHPISVVKRSRWNSLDRNGRRVAFSKNFVYVKNDGMNQLKYDLTKLGDDSLHHSVDMTMEREAHGTSTFTYRYLTILMLLLPHYPVRIPI